MKCEKCEQELLGGAVICRQCGFNNALQRIGGWRAKQEFPAQSHTGQATSRRSQDATLIPFPVSPHRSKSSETAKEASAPSSPPWRQRLDETIREIRERRAEDHQRQALAPPLEPNPIVEAAVKRLQRDATPASSSGSSSNALSRSTGQGAQAAAFAIQCDDEPEPLIESRSMTSPITAKHAASTSTATLPVKPVTQTAGLTQTRAAHPARHSSTTTSAPAPDAGNKLDQMADVPHAHTVEAATHAVEDDVASFDAAPLLMRALASVIDVAIIVLSGLPFLTAFTFFEAEFDRASLYLLAAIAVAAIFCYHLLTVAVAGRTSGMALCKLRIVDAASECVPPTVTQAFGRAFGATLSLLLLPLNLLVILLSLERLSLSDHISSTIIVRQEHLR